jgi:hypothetical protein
VSNLQEEKRPHALNQVKAEDLERESNRNVVLFFEEELAQIAKGRRLDQSTRRVLRKKGLITNSHQDAAFKLTALAIRLLKETTP